MTIHTVPLERLSHCYKIPTYAHDADAGMDVYAAEGRAIAPGGWEVIGTGIKVQLPLNKELEVCSRSGLAAKHGVMVLNSPGTIDPDYSDEVGVILANLGDEVYTVLKGDKIAQLKLRPIEKIVWQRVKSVQDSESRDGGFGSTDNAGVTIG